MQNNLSLCTLHSVMGRILKQIFFKSSEVFTFLIRNFSIDFKMQSEYSGLLRVDKNSHVNLFSKIYKKKY